MTNPSTRAAAAIAFGALLATGTACGAAAEKVGERAVERAVESQGGGDVDLDLSDGGFNIETEDGTFTAGSGEVPASWPDDIGFPSGAEVLTGMEQVSGSESLVNVTVTIVGSAADVVVFYEDALSSWSTENESSFSGGGTESRSVTFVSGDRRLDLFANDAGDGTVQAALSHTVTQG